VAQLGEHRQPVLGALVAVAQPDPQHLFAAIDVDADRQVGGLVDHGAVVADLDHQGVDVHDRVDRLEGSGLPFVEFLDDPVGDPRDQLRGHVNLVDLGQMPADVAHRQPAGVERDDPFVEPV
jgi:hypothetical protein